MSKTPSPFLRFSLQRNRRFEGLWIDVDDENMVRVNRRTWPSSAFSGDFPWPKPRLSSPNLMPNSSRNQKRIVIVRFSLFRHTIPSLFSISLSLSLSRSPFFFPSIAHILGILIVLILFPIRSRYALLTSFDLKSEDFCGRRFADSSDLILIYWSTSLVFGLIWKCGFWRCWVDQDWQSEGDVIWIRRWLIITQIRLRLRCGV